MTPPKFASVPARFRFLYDVDPTRRHMVRVMLFCAWAVVTAYLAWNHAVWRDEVRALSFALSGNNVFAMLHTLHGEGHPALWYLMLRGAHTVFGTPLVLQGVAYVVAFAAMALLMLRSPFRWQVLMLLLVGRFALSEYTVMARNYGISMLLLFLLAWLYPRCRERGFVLGGLLLLLANTNAHSVLLVGAFLLFWLTDILLGDRERRAAALNLWFLNAAVACIGCVLCAITILPTINDAAQTVHPSGLKVLIAAASAVVFPAHAMDSIFGQQVLARWMAHHHLWHRPYSLLTLGFESMLLYGSTLGLVRRPAALVGALAGLVSFDLFFTLIYPGNFRHQALWVVLLIAMYWIAGRTGGMAVESQWTNRVATVGSGIFMALLAVQAANGLRQNAPMLLHRAPESRVRDLAQVIRSRPDLKDATVIADPDYLVEAVPYYLSNPTYLVREDRFGTIVIFTRRARLELTLDDLLRKAQVLHGQSGRPVVILLQHELDAASPTETLTGYDWTFSTTPQQVERFRTATQVLKRFGPVAGGNDETFTAYVLL